MTLGMEAWTSETGESRVKFGDELLVPAGLYSRRKQTGERLSRARAGIRQPGRGEPKGRRSHP